MSVQSIKLSELEKGKAGEKSLLGDNIELIKDVKVNIQVMLGEAELPVEELFSLGRDSVVKLDREITSPVDIVLNGKVIARGQLVAAEDNFGVQITQINT